MLVFERDDAQCRCLKTAASERCRFSVEVCHNPDDALSSYKARLPDVIIVDVRDPKRNSSLELVR